MGRVSALGIRGPLQACAGANLDQNLGWTRDQDWSQNLATSVARNLTGLPDLAVIIGQKLDLGVKKLQSCILSGPYPQTGHRVDSLAV